MGKEDEAFFQLEKTIREKGDTDFDVGSKPLKQGSTQDASARLVASRESSALEDFDKDDGLDEAENNIFDPEVQAEIQKIRVLRNEEMIEPRITIEVNHDGNVYKVTAPLDKSLLDTTKFRYQLEDDVNAPKGMVLKVYSIKGNNLVYLDGNIEVKDKDWNKSGNA